MEGGESNIVLSSYCNVLGIKLDTIVSLINICSLLMRIEKTNLAYVICLLSHYKLQIQAQIHPSVTPCLTYHVAFPFCNYIGYICAYMQIEEF